MRAVLLASLLIAALTFNAAVPARASPDLSLEDPEARAFEDMEATSFNDVQRRWDWGGDEPDLWARGSVPPPSPTDPPYPTGPKPNGSQCTSSAQCQTGNCNYKKCSDRQEPGTTCYKQQNCVSSVCNKFKCVSPPKSVPLDGYCNDGGQCSGSLFCSAKSRCKNLLANGKTCRANSSCSSGNCVSKKCVSDKSLAKYAYCTADKQCKDALFCSKLWGSKCRPQFGHNAKCSRDAVCASGDCKGNGRCA